MSSPIYQLSSLKRNRCIIYSSDSDNYDGSVRSRPRLGSVDSVDIVSDQDKEYTMSPISMSLQSSGSVDSPDDKEYTIPEMSLSSKCTTPTDDALSPSSRLPMDTGDILSDILQAAGIQYSDVEFDSDPAHDEKYRDKVTEEMHDNASWTSDNSTINSNDDKDIAINDAYIHYHSGDFKITPEELHNHVSHPEFDFAAAAKLIHTNFSFD